MEYSIGEFANIVGLTAHTLRYYEKEGLLATKRNRGGQRVYLEADLRWVEFIKRLKETGMPIRQIKTYADYRALGDKTMPARVAMLATHRQHILDEIDRWKEHLENMDRKIKFYEEVLSKKVA